MKRIFKTFIVALCLTAVACTDYQVDIDDLNDRIDTLEKNQIANISQQISSINNTLPQMTATSAELKGMIESMEKTIKDYKDVVIDNETKLAVLKTEIEAEIEKLSSDIEKSQDADKKEMLAALTATKAELEGQLEALNTEAAAKNKQLDEALQLLKDKDASIGNRIDSLKTFVTDELASAKSYTEKTYATLAQQKLIEYDIAAIKTSIEDLEESMTELEARLTANYTTAIQNASKALNDRISSVADEIVRNYTAAIATAKSEITTAYENKIEKSIEKLRTEVQGWVNTQLKLYWTAEEIGTKLTSLKTDLEGQLSAQKTYLEKVEAAYKAADEKLGAADIELGAEDDRLEGLIGENATAIKTNGEAIEKINDETLPALKKEIEAAYKQAITDGITAQCVENGIIDKRIDELIGNNNTRLLNLYINPMLSNISALQDSVKNLRASITKYAGELQKVSQKLNGFIDGRIQSLTYIPVSADGQYLAGTTDCLVYGDFVMNFQVNPVSMAKDITAENISAKVSYMTPYGKQQYYESVKVKDVAVNKENGIITVTVAAADVFNREDISDEAIWWAHNAAISVSVKDTDENHAETYYDVASDFVYLNTEHFFINFTTSANVTNKDKDKFYAHSFQLNKTNNDYDYGENTAHLLGHNFIHVDNTTTSLKIQLAQGSGSTQVNDKVKSVTFGGLYERDREKYCKHHDYVVLETGLNAFSNCPYLDTVNIYSLDVTNVSSFESMFENDYALKGVRIHGAEVQNVTTAAKMFKNCTSLKEVNLNDWATEKITNFSEMFANCTKLELADQNWSSFNQSTAVNFSGMFRGTAITKVDFSGLNVKVNSLQNMFNGCTALKNVTLSGNSDGSAYKVHLHSGATYDGNAAASATADLGHMFDGCTALEKVVLSNWSFDNLPNFEYMFANCTSLKYIYLENWYVGSDLSSYYTNILKSMFDQCNNIEAVYMKGSTDNAVNLIKAALGETRANLVKTE